MARRPTSDEDRLVPSTPKPKAAPSAPTTAALPMDQSPPLADQRRIVEAQIAELEGALHFMGTTHPQRRDTEQRLAHLRALLKKMPA